MSEFHAPAAPSMASPGLYRIRVQGILVPRWSDRVGGMSITTQTPEGGTAETILVGRLPDQAALSGVLSTLYDLGLPLLSVECLDTQWNRGQR